MLVFVHIALCYEIICDPNKGLQKLGHDDSDRFHFQVHISPDTQLINTVMRWTAK